MANSLHEPLTSAQKDMVGKLAAGLFPLDTWLHSPHKYQPPVPPLPDRKSVV